MSATYQLLQVTDNPHTNSKYIECNSPDCPFNRSCAQHETAGDFRMEDGFSPEIKKDGKFFFCKTRSDEIDIESVYKILPITYDKLDRGIVKIH